MKNVLVFVLAAGCILGAGCRGTEKRTPEIDAGNGTVNTAEGSEEEALYLVKVTSPNMNFRVEPSADSAQVGGCPVLYFDAVLKVYEEQGEWRRVEDLYGHRGWARAEYEGNRYLEKLPADYLQTHITAKKAYERAEPVAKEWASDAYLTQVGTPLHKYVGWNGLTEEWVCAFCSPTTRSPTKETVSGDQPYDFIYLEVTVGPEGIRQKEIALLDAFGGCPACRIITNEKANTSFIDSCELFTPDRITLYRSRLKNPDYLAPFVRGDFIDEWFATPEALSLYLNGDIWSIQGIEVGEPKNPCLWLGPRIDLDAASGSIAYIDGLEAFDDF